MARFPHLKDAPTAFGPGRELYEQIPGEFDQGRWSEAQAHAKLMCVPWCGDYDNVVAFASDAARDEWIDSQEGYAFETDWRRPPEGSYKVEVPYATALLYNYLVLDFPTPTSDAKPLPGVSEESFRRLCYFVTDARQSSASTTELSIELDVWTTFMGTLDVTYLQLAQGHAPMVEVSPQEYLRDPAARSRHLLAPDVSAGAPTYAASAHEALLSDDVTVVIFTTARITSGWGGKYGATPADSLNYNGESATSAVAWAVADGDLDSLISDVVEQHPSFLQTVQGIASVPTRLLTLTGSVTFCGHTLRRCAARGATLPLVDLSVEDFGYDADYAGIAKLYTSPYAHIEITDETGEVSVVRVEETHGSVDALATISLAWPYLRVATQVVGMGSARAASDLSWEVLEGAFAAELAPRWYDTLREREVPVFSVSETSATSYDWSAHYTNAQRALAADNSRASALASNATARTNAQNSASNITSNNAVSVAAANSMVATNTAAATQGAIYSTIKLTQDVASDLNSMYASLIADQATLAVAATNNDAQAAVAGTSTVVTGIAEIAASALTGDIGGAAGAAANMVMGGAQQATAWASTNASIAVSQSNSRALYEASVTAASEKGAHANTYTTSSTSLNNSTLTSNNATQQQAATSIAANNASLVNTNAANTKTTADANAQRAYATSTSAISNDTAQAALGNVIVHGRQEPGPSSLRPMMVQASVVTQSPGEIALAGDHMLRYGYACDFAWHVTEWCPCERFCYWQASDVWMSGKGNVAERYQRAIKDILLRGVTVWKNPSDIGSVSVYDNGF